MSTLQIALVGLGILIVAGIYLFNRWQESRYRKRAESAFQQRHADVLMNDSATPPPAPAARVRDRIEPQMQDLDTEASGPTAATATRPAQTDPYMSRADAAPASTPPAAASATAGVASVFAGLTPAPSGQSAAAATPASAGSAPVAAPAEQIDVLKEQITAELRADRRAVAREESWVEPTPMAPGANLTTETSDAVEPVKVEPRAIDNSAPAASPPGADRLDYALDLVSQSPISHGALDRFLKQLSDLSRRVQLWGAHDNRWLVVDVAGAPRFARVRATLQLVNRSGMVSREDLLTFCRAMERCATDVEANVEGPDPEGYVKKAMDLETFCQKADVVVGLNVMAQKSGPFAGTKLRAWAEAAGFQLRPSGAFHLTDEHGLPLIVMESQENPGFLPERIRTLTTKGVTLLLDAPVVPDGLHAFDRLVGLARNLASTMGGVVVDDNHAGVSDAGLSQIRGTLKKIYEEMDARGIPAGSALAQRLFQ